MDTFTIHCASFNGFTYEAKLRFNRAVSVFATEGNLTAVEVEEQQSLMALEVISNMGQEEEEVTSKERLFRASADLTQSDTSESRLLTAEASKQLRQ